MTFDDAKWFAVHVYSGYENKVATNIEKVVENRSMQDRILDVKVPTEQVTTIKNEKTVTSERKLYPSYVFVKCAVFYDTQSGEMKMTDETWYLIRNTRGVTGFVGPNNTPKALTEAEAINMGVEKRTVEVRYAVGDTVSIIDGPFESFQGIVDFIDTDNDVVRVIISMMGRETPIEMGLDQVELTD